MNSRKHVYFVYVEEKLKQFKIIFCTPKLKKGESKRVKPLLVLPGFGFCTKTEEVTPIIRNLIKCETLNFKFDQARKEIYIRNKHTF